MEFVVVGEESDENFIKDGKNYELKVKDLCSQARRANIRSLYTRRNRNITKCTSIVFWSTSIAIVIASILGAMLYEKVKQGRHVANRIAC
ncbi:hypothetical protein [Cellulosilyticum ruminicola]|uniref:hypothetical protein n=1 Tax=Cellulosilyticum ruminicola TaxID=425254 RepID=UPI0006D0BA81|nr:hypothetical protein [Cellulosilyticum ruminicola]